MHVFRLREAGIYYGHFFHYDKTSQSALPFEFNFGKSFNQNPRSARSNNILDIMPCYFAVFLAYPLEEPFT